MLSVLSYLTVSLYFALFYLCDKIKMLIWMSGMHTCFSYFWLSFRWYRYVIPLSIIWKIHYMLLQRLYVISQCKISSYWTWFIDCELGFVHVYLLMCPELIWPQLCLVSRYQCQLWLLPLPCRKWPTQKVCESLTLYLSCLCQVLGIFTSSIGCIKPS